jgi:hypothetical protein
MASSELSEIIPSSGLPGDNSRATVSDYSTYYGTYSGADIKVVVHYPYNSTLEKILQTTKSEVVAELQQAESTFWSTRNSMDTQQFVTAIGRLEALRAELAEIDEQTAEIKNLPTTKTLGEITSFSWSVHRDKGPYRTLGRTYPKTYTRGPRTIAGTMIFTVFHEHVLHELLRLHLGYYSTGTSDFDKYTYTTMLVDQLPPLDISLIFANEYGAISHMGFWGIEFFQEGGTFSIQDIFSENVLQYVARDFDPLHVVGKRVIDGAGVTDNWHDTASSMLVNEAQAIAHLTRRNPYI